MIFDPFVQSQLRLINTTRYATSKLQKMVSECVADANICYLAFGVMILLFIIIIIILVQERAESLGAMDLRSKILEKLESSFRKTNSVLLALD
jgi:hypothetical protein